jgi:PAS domain S-box-containing protein
VSDTETMEGLRAALHDAERRLQAVVGAFGPQMGTFEFELVEPDTLVFVAADAQAAEMVTVVHAGHFGKPLLEVFTGMAQTDLPAALLATARHGAPLNGRSYVPPGTRLGRAFSLFAFQSAPGRVTMKLWQTTELPQMQEIARRNQELLARIFNESPVAIALVAAPDERIVDVNGEWSSLTGCTREQALGRPWCDFGFPPGSANLLDAASAPGVQGRIHDRPVSLLTRDGRSLSLWLHGAAIDLGGQPHRLVYLLDVTVRQAQEQALARHRDELEQLVEERTAELAQARDRAERASGAKSAFLSGMSHELRTPMNAILGFAQLLESDTEPPLSPGQHGHVRQILRAGAHLLELITEVLDLARIEAGKLQVSLEPVRVQALLDDCLSLMRPVALDFAINLIPAAPPGCDGHVMADRLRARQVLLNLLSNAVKYNREHGRVWVDCAVDGDRVCISVCDDGPGLSDEQQQRLFRDFERLQADQSAIEGTGIGLALSRRLVTLMHGEIGIDSAPGQGSRFWVRLPRVAQVPMPVASISRDAAASVPATPARSVLYVEDNPVNIALMEAILTQRPQLTLVSAPLPTLGLELARANPPDLILLDIQLPGMDGYELLRRLRLCDATRDVPAVAISANAMPADIRRGLAAGFTRYLTKPLDVKQVLQVVDELLSRQAS